MVLCGVVDAQMSCVPPFWVENRASAVIAAFCAALSCLSRGMLWGGQTLCGLASMLLTSAQNWNGRGESDCLIKT